MTADALTRIRERGHIGIRLGLARMQALLAQLGDPQRSLRGTLIAGTVSLGDDLVASPLDRGGKVRGIQVHGEEVEQARAGQRTAINLKGPDREELARGLVLVRQQGLSKRLMLKRSLRLGESLSGRVAALNRPLVVDDLESNVAAARALGRPQRKGRADPVEDLLPYTRWISQVRERSRRLRRTGISYALLATALLAAMFCLTLKPVD